MTMNNCLTLQVVFVDFGNTEVVGKEHLRLLDEEFMLDPIQCYACRLSNVIPVGLVLWTMLSIDQFKAWMH
jgi:Tudor domain